MEEAWLPEAAMLQTPEETWRVMGDAQGLAGEMKKLTDDPHSACDLMRGPGRLSS